MKNQKSLLHRPGEILLHSDKDLGKFTRANNTYDPELLYVECRNCSQPVFWEHGRTTMLLMQSDIDLDIIDEYCLILSDGCRDCMPNAKDFALSIIRLASLSLPEIIMMHKRSGNA